MNKIPVLLLFLISCRSPAKDTIVIDSSKIGKIKSVVILGNSIVRHPPAPAIGWDHDWGMAASAPDSDFVHILIRNIKAKDSSVRVRFANIADFERSYEQYNFSALDSLKNPDMLLVKISENVSDSNTGHFTKYYDSLVNYVDPERKAVRVIADGFWKKEKVNGLIRDYAIHNNYTFLDLASLSDDKGNTAAGQYKNKGINNHPSDRGMKAIAAKFWVAIKPYFK